MSRIFIVIVVFFNFISCGSSCIVCANNNSYNVISYTNTAWFELQQMDPKFWHSVVRYSRHSLGEQKLSWSQGFTWDSKRNRFIVALISDRLPGKKMLHIYQELKAIDAYTFKTVKAVGHNDLNHANSLTYCAETDEILCTTTTVQGKKRLIRVIDAGTLITKGTIALPLKNWPREFHLAFDPLTKKFVMRRSAPFDAPIKNKEHLWVCAPVIKRGSIIDFTVEEQFDVELGDFSGKNKGMSNGLGIYGGIALIGGERIIAVDCIKKKIIGMCEIGSFPEVEDFVFANGAWYVNTNKVFTIFKYDRKMKARITMEDYMKKLKK